MKYLWRYFTLEISQQRNITLLTQMALIETPGSFSTIFMDLSVLSRNIRLQVGAENRLSAANGVQKTDGKSGMIGQREEQSSRFSCLWLFLEQFISTGPLDSQTGRIINQEDVCCRGVC